MSISSLTLIDLNTKRDSLLKYLEQNKDTLDSKTIQDIDNEIDQYSEKIINFIKQYIDSLSVETVMQHLSYLGQCVNLLNDDNGNWAVVSDGFQNIVYGDNPQDVETTFFVKADQWKSSIKLALVQYLFNEEE